MKSGKGLVEYAKSKVGTPYFYGAKMEILTNSLMARMHSLYPGTVTDSYMRKAKEKGQVGKENTDCSGLIGGYREKQIGSAQLYQTAYARLSVDEYHKWADGVVCYRNGHVGVFAREGCEFVVYEAKGIDYGTVRSPFVKSKWTAGLTFADMTYEYEDKASATWKGVNPYTEPTVNVKRGMKGEIIKWVQWELKEAGYEIDIDGDFGVITDQTVRAFQKSCKIEVDGIVGEITRKHLKVNSSIEIDQTGYRFGIDVSKYQGVIDWAKVKASGIEFAILKVTAKDNAPEEFFERNYIGCKHNGIKTAVYKYVYATSLEKAQAEARGIVDALRDKEIGGKVWLDMEDHSLLGIGQAALTLIINQEAKILKAAGYKVGIYCNRDWYEKVLDGVGLSKKHRFWIAKYGANDGKWQGRTDNPKDIAVMWQYTSKGHVDGIQGYVDMNLKY